MPVSLINKTLKLAAAELGLDPSRLLPHSIRVGHAVQTNSLSDTDQMLLTGHRSLQGHMPYCRRTLDMARRATVVLHDPTIQTLEHTKFVYMTPHT